MTGDIAMAVDCGYVEMEMCNILHSGNSTQKKKRMDKMKKKVFLSYIFLGYFFSKKDQLDRSLVFCLNFFHIK